MAASTEPTTQACPDCGQELSITGAAPGSWLACPGCGTPVEVHRPTTLRRAQAAAASAAAPAVPELPSTTWAADPRLGKPERLPRPEPVRLGCISTVLLAFLSGLAQLMFVGGVLGNRNPTELTLSWFFGFCLALFIASMAGATRVAPGPPRT